MKLGYVSTPQAIGCKANRRFRLASYSEARLVETVASNLACLGDILRFNVAHGLLFFRISSDLVPFASHPVCTFDWCAHFRPTLERLGSFVRAHGIRISMHPGQYTILNSPDAALVGRSLAELDYHCTLLEALGLDASAKIQIHVGGLYGDKLVALNTFCRNYERMAPRLKARLAIENDDGRFSLEDCLAVHAQVGVPVIFDTLHHECLNQGEPLAEALRAASATWGSGDGIPMVDYSSQQPGRRVGTHAETLDVPHFRGFLKAAEGMELDVMFELRDKEASALRAGRLLASDGDGGR